MNHRPKHINRKLALSHGAKIMPFKKLPKEAQYAIIYYMVVNGEAWDVSDELDASFTEGWKVQDSSKCEDIHKKALMTSSSMKFYIKKYGDVQFGYGHIPTSVMKREVLKRNNVYGDLDDFETFEDYHNWYSVNGDLPNHSTKNRWPSILSSFDDEVLEDGWHRFNTYVSMKCRTIPCIFYIND